MTKLTYTEGYPLAMDAMPEALRKRPISTAPITCDRETFKVGGVNKGEPRFRIAADSISKSTPAPKENPMPLPHTDQAKRLYRKALDTKLVNGEISAAMHRRLIAEDAAIPTPGLAYDAINFPNAGRLKDPYRS